MGKAGAAVSQREMSLTARAFWVSEPGAGEIREEPVEPPGSGDVLVRARYSAVSRGTEALVFHGRVPVSEHTRMRCPNQQGTFPAPVKYGYASVGRVEHGSERLLGRAVFCLFPHQTLYVVPEAQVIPLPADVPLERAVLAANMETAVNALWDARPLVGDRISIVGAGVVGCLCAYIASRNAFADIELVDRRPERAAIAEAFGVGFALPEAARDERDLLLHASGTPEGLRTALALAAPEAEVLELSWFGDREVTLPLGGAFHVRRLALRSSQVGTLSPNARARYTARDRLAFSLALCADPVLDVLIDDESPFEELPVTMVKLASPSAAALCHRVRYA